MIIDYKFSKSKHRFSISYVTERGGKALLNYDISKFKSYYEDPAGAFTNWNGHKCSVKWTDKPGAHDLRTFIRELPDPDRKKLMGRANPRLYTYDIETDIGDQDEFPEPSEAKFPILNISIVNDTLDTIILGTRELDGTQEELQASFDQWLDDCEFYKKLEFSRKPTIKYAKFQSEEDMLVYFLKNIVAKAPVLAGWNSMLFDWYYITTRLERYYPDIPLSLCSVNGDMTMKVVQDMRGNKVRLSVPVHTLLIDMMDIVGSFDITMMKESLSLDYISSAAVGMHKIKYKGDLKQLYNEDYMKFVFYNAIDSVLVQLIDKKLKTLNILEAQALYMQDKISFAFSKIAIAESIFFQHWYNEGIKIVQPKPFEGDRGELKGAFVGTPVPGRHNWMACLDFASLYPVTQCTCNISFENYMGRDWTEDQLEKFRADPNYFVSVRGTVYKNDKDYTLRKIQSDLRRNRATGKYLAKQLDAVVMSDAEHIIKGKRPKDQEYPDNIKKDLEELGYSITSTNDLYSIDLQEFMNKLKSQITYYQSYEQAVKLIMNSIYGGSSHVMFDWFNIDVANDTTAEGRDLIHLMNAHIPKFFHDHWYELTELHKKLGIELIPGRPADVQIIYNDTDSAYICYDTLLHTIKGFDEMPFRRKVEILVGIHRDFLDKHNNEFMAQHFAERHVKSFHEFELETIAKSGLWIDVKKRYAQILVWKDGKYFDEDDLPMKVKGLEIIKSSYPAQTRKTLKNLVRAILEYSGDNSGLFSYMNQLVQKEKQAWLSASLEDICGNISVNNYTKYIIDDTDPMGVKMEKGTPFAVRGLATYNNIRQVHGLPGDPLYGGKMKYYVIKPQVARKRTYKEQFFCFPAGSYPDWASQYAPIDKIEMFVRCTLDPLNRIMTAIGYKPLRVDGYIDISLFD